MKFYSRNFSYILQLTITCFSFRLLFDFNGRMAKNRFYSPYYFHTKSEFKMSNKQFWLFCTIFLPMTQTQATTRVFTLYLNFVFWKEGYALYLFLSPRVVTLRRGKNKENRPRRTHVTREKFNFIFVGQKHEPKIVVT